MDCGPLRGEQALEQLPSSLRQLTTLERFHLHQRDTYQDLTRDPTFDTSFFPQNCKVFRLPCFWVPTKLLYCFGRQDLKEGELDLFRGCGSAQTVLFAVHPTAVSHYEELFATAGASYAKDEEVVIWALPTSSTRTLLAWPDESPGKAIFVKTSLHSPIFGNRSLRVNDVARSVGLSALIEESKSCLSTTFDYLPERLGFVPRSMRHGGAIIRSVPSCVKDNGVVLAPFFSLFGADAPRVPLLLTVLQRSRLDPLQFAEDVICAPFARMWLHMSMNCGLLLEAHSQDLLIAFSPELLPLQRFFYRDFEGLDVDWDLRRARGLSTLIDLPHPWCCDYSNESGARYAHLVWFKIWASLYHYIDDVVKNAEASLEKWQKQGLIAGSKIRSGDVTSMFSRHMSATIDRLFGCGLKIDYDVCYAPAKFVLELMKLRRELMTQSPSTTTECSLRQYRADADARN